jgi:hypothetical protein
LAGRAVLSLALFITGVAWLSGEDPFSSIGFVLVIPVLFSLGYMSGQWASVLFALFLIPAAVVADWLAFGPEITRGEEYEPIPVTPFVAIGIPIPMLVIGLGVAVDRFKRGRRRRAPM